MELELKHIAPYLPYNLDIQILNSKSDYVGLLYSKINGYYLINENPHFTYFGGSTGKSFSEFKPILQPLSDYLDINSSQMNALNCDLSDQINIMNLAHKVIHYGQLSYTTIQIMVGAHIDFQGLIHAGLAIDINTL